MLLDITFIFLCCCCCLNGTVETDDLLGMSPSILYVLKRSDSPTHPRHLLLTRSIPSWQHQRCIRTQQSSFLTPRKTNHLRNFLSIRWPRRNTQETPLPRFRILSLAFRLARTNTLGINGPFASQRIKISQKLNVR